MSLYSPGCEAGSTAIFLCQIHWKNIGFNLFRKGRETECQTSNYNTSLKHAGELDNPYKMEGLSAEM